MSRPELPHLKLLAEVDALLEQLGRWAEEAPDWQPVYLCRALVRRLSERAESLRVRLAAPLVVATLGGSGTGKSALMNALLGADVVPTGRRRPTTTRPLLICRPDLTPEMLGIDRQSVELVQVDLPALTGMVLIDCPDPDTTEETAEEAAAAEVADTVASHQAVEGVAAAAVPHRLAEETNLGRLRRILPHCDVLLVTTTQQKYRSARVADELAVGAAGARLVFVQTHADTDQDIRNDWRKVLEPQYAVGHVFFIDSLAALRDAKSGLEPRGEFAALEDLLTRQLAGAAGARIRRANFLDLLEETLASCRATIEERLPAVRQVEAAIAQHRARLAGLMAQQMRGELLSSRRPWEQRLLGQVASRWGMSPFALVLRIYQGLGALISGAVLMRARTPAQIALWGAVTGARTWQQRRQVRRAEESIDRALTACWDPAEVRSAAVVLEGYAAEAGLTRVAARPETVTAEAGRAGVGFVSDVGAELDALIAKLAARHSGWFTRLRYELLLAVVLGFLLYRLGKNFFYDSWWVASPAPVFGLEFYVSAGFWLVLWCFVLLWAFTGRLRRGLRREIDGLAERWNSPAASARIFAHLETECRRAKAFHTDLDRLEQHVGQLRRELAQPDGDLGYRR